MPTQKLRQSVPKMAQLLRPFEDPHKREAIPVQAPRMQLQLHPESELEQAYGDPPRKEEIPMQLLQPRLLHQIQFKCKSTFPIFLIIYLILIESYASSQKRFRKAESVPG